MSKPATFDDFISPLFTRLQKIYPYKHLDIPCAYVIESQGKLYMEGSGWLHFLIQVKENWFISYATFLTKDHRYFDKMLLNKLNEKKQLINCHSYYIDEEDLKKRGGTLSLYDLYDIMTVLIDHAEKHNEEDCPACRGVDERQDHFIQMF